MGHQWRRGTHLRLELCKLEASTVKLNQPLGPGRLRLPIRRGTALDGRRRLPLAGSARLLCAPSLTAPADLAVLALPYEIGLATAAAHVVVFLHREPCCSGRGAGQRAYEAVDADIVGVLLSARGALNSEHVPERAVLAVVGPQARDSSVVRSAVRPLGAQRVTPTPTAPP